MCSPASLGILRWGNASEQKLEVRELRSPASHYTLTTDLGKPAPERQTILHFIGARDDGEVTSAGPYANHLHFAPDR